MHFFSIVFIFYIHTSQFISFLLSYSPKLQFSSFFIWLPHNSLEMLLIAGLISLIWLNRFGHMSCSCISLSCSVLLRWNVCCGPIPLLGGLCRWLAWTRVTDSSLWYPTDLWSVLPALSLTCNVMTKQAKMLPEHLLHIHKGLSSLNNKLQTIWIWSFTLQNVTDFLLNKLSAEQLSVVAHFLL